jgi:hypothetical protein
MRAKGPLSTVFFPALLLHYLSSVTRCATNYDGMDTMTRKNRMPAIAYLRTSSANVVR